MKFSLVIVSSTIMAFSTIRPSSAYCDISSTDSGWLVRIYKGHVTYGHGAIVLKGRVLSAFTDFSRDINHIEAYMISAYGIECQQLRHAKKIFPPQEWSNPDGIYRDVAFWSLDEDFQLSPDFPLIFPPNGDASKIEYVISSVKTGSQCTFITFKQNQKVKEGTVIKKMVTVEKASSCEQIFCVDGLCYLEARFDYCTVDTTDRWRRGGVLLCNYQPVAIMAVNGVGNHSRGHNLFVNLLTAWEVHTGVPLRPYTTTTTSARVNTTPTTTKNKTTSKGTIRTSPSKKRPANVTSNIPRPQNRLSTTAAGPTFLLTIPDHVKPFTTDGSQSVVSSAALALFAIVL